MRYKMSMFNEE